jgi:hypothetical protein
MRNLFVAVLLFASLLSADMRKVIKTTVGDHETIRAEYVQGSYERIEYLSHSSQDPYLPVTIFNTDRKLHYILDLAARKYVEVQQEKPDLILSLAALIARPPRFHDSGKTVDVYFETTDTGERKEFFGRTAQHLVIRERRVAEPGACGTSSQAEKDGWYIPENSVRAYSYLATSMANCRDKLVFHGRPAPPGITVVEKNGSFAVELLELSDAPLDKSLFEVPSGFEKVDALPGQPVMSFSQKMQWEWGQLGWAFKSWF